MNFQGLSQKIQTVTLERYKHTQEFIRSKLLKGKKPQLPPGEIVTSTLVCQIGPAKVVLFEIEKKGPSIRLVRYQHAENFEGETKPPEMLKQLLEKGNFSARKVRVSIKGQGVIIRFIQFPQMRLQELRGAVSYEVEKYIPFKAAEVAVDFHIVDSSVKLPSGVGMELLLVAVKKDELYALVRTLQGGGLQVELIDVDALAAINAIEFFYPEAFNTSCGLLIFGTDISTLCIIREGKPRFIRDISYAKIDIVKLLKRKLGLADADAAAILDGDKTTSPEAIEVVRQGFSNLASDLKVSVDYYSDQAQSSEPVKTFFIEGAGQHHVLMAEIATKSLGFSVQPLDLLSKITLDASISPELVRKNSEFLPVALGLALREK